MKIKSQHIALAAVSLLLVIIIVISNLLNIPLPYKAKEYKDFSISEEAPKEVSLSANTASEADELIGENGDIKLYYNFKTNLFYILNAATGDRWNSFVDAQTAPNHNFQTRPVDMLFNIAVYNTENDITEVLTSKTATSIKYSGLENGIAVEYEFLKQDLNITFQYYLKDGSFMCRIPREEIKENGTCWVLNIDLLPFFGATGITAKDNGYILYPDGCGALYTLGETAAGSSSYITKPVYGEHIIELDRIIENNTRKINNVKLPYYGIKNGNNAMIAYICDGDDSANITLSPYGCLYNLNRVYSTSLYRRMQSTTSADGTTFYDTEEKMRAGDYTVRYSFLSGDDADYSGMANNIKDYLTKTGRIKASEVSYDAYIDLLMGVEKKSVMGYSYKAVTSAEDAKNIVNDLMGDGMKASVTLLGWQEEGYGIYPTTANVSSKIGGKSGLKDLNTDKADINLSYYSVLSNSTETGTKIRRDAISSIRNITIMDKAEEHFILNPVRIFKNYTKSLKQMLKYECDGITLTGFDIVYDDYNKSGGVTRKETANIFKNLFEKTSESGNKVVVENASAFAYNKASVLAKMPEENSGLPIFSASVPVLYMVLNDVIPYSLATPGNFSSDLDRTKLKWIEYDALPYFVLTNEDSQELVETAAAGFFSTMYSEKGEEAKAIINEVKEVSDNFKDATITGHETVSENIRITEYSNGKKIYFNYGDNAATYNGIEIPAIGYVIK